MNLKISNLTNLQDARYCAAVGFQYIGFNLERGSLKKLPAPTVWNIATWLEGPQLVIETNVESLSELTDASVEPAFLSFPIQEWDPQLFNYGSAITLRTDTSSKVEELEAILKSATDKNIKVELSVNDVSEYAAYHSIKEDLFLHFPTLDIAYDFLAKGEDLPFGVSFREEAEEEPNFLNYEKLDELMAIFSDVHL